MMKLKKNSEEQLEFWNRLSEFNNGLKRLERKWEKIKEEASSLFIENQELKKENEELKRIIGGSKKKEQSEETGQANLQHLYEEGYHVCPFDFGEKRKGDCLFCREFLQKAYGEEKD